jgi:hypothetical protein
LSVRVIPMQSGLYQEPDTKFKRAVYFEFHSK